MTVPDRIKGAVFLPVGLLLLVAAVFLAISTHDYLQRTARAPGLVIAEPYGPHHVDIRFRTHEGRELTYSQNGEVTLHTGQRVTVIYDPRDPAMDPCVDELPAIWGTTAFLVLMGSVFSLIGGGLLAGKLGDEDEAA
jgi:hypothetical protein